MVPLALIGLLALAACTDGGDEDGSPPRRGRDQMPDCSQPDVLAGSEYVSDGVMHVRVAAGSDRARSLHPEWVAFEPSFSPDGTAMVVTRATKGDYESAGPSEVELWTMALDGSHARAITDGRTEVSQPSWSPDGRTILFREWEHGAGLRLATVPADGSKPATPLPVTGHLERAHATWSPDGTQIAYVHVVDPLSLLNEQKLMVVAADGTGPRAIATLDGDTGFVWNPDGRSFTARSGVHPLSTINLDGTTAELGDFGFPVGWSADGERLYLRDPSVGELRVVEVADGRVTPLRTPLNLRGDTTWTALSPVPVEGC